MCWGGATAGKTFCAANPWSGWTGVWHMSEESGTVADSTGNGLSATPAGKDAAAAADNPVGDDNVWSGLSENIDDPAAYVFAGGLPAPDKTLYFTRPAGPSPVVDRDVAMPPLPKSTIPGFGSCQNRVSSILALTRNLPGA